MSDQYMQERIMQLQRDRIAHGGLEGGKGPSRASKKSAKTNPWLLFVKEFRSQCKMHGEVCDLKMASELYHRGNKARGPRAVSSGSKTNKKKFAVRKAGKCVKYDPINPAFWREPSGKCIKYTTHVTKRKAAMPKKRKAALPKKRKSPLPKKRRAQGGCNGIPCARCNGLGYEEEY